MHVKQLKISKQDREHLVELVEFYEQEFEKIGLDVFRSQLQQEIRDLATGASACDSENISAELWASLLAGKAQIR